MRTNAGNFRDNLNDDDHDDHHDDELSTQIPTVPNRDLGTGGTEEVDGPRNTDDLPDEDRTFAPPS